ncbi:acyl carrier protein [Mycobacterium sp.]|uniref:acyl carrier protein n=1 Tax=Mycobacterium sp. TaxID=1785 RepID=UPI002BBF8CA0|nr:acyl carrier protein [Mycobacterium sp.]HTY34552.1 acyl carrier protein [Mycobacterium sp.]
MSVIEKEVLALVAAMAPAANDPHLHDTLMVDLGYTSLRLLELSIALERAFGLPPLTPESLAGVSTVGDLVNLVRKQQDSS